METIELTTEKLLVFENAQEIGRLRNDAAGRSMQLNRLIGAGLTLDEIRAITKSKNDIDAYILKRQLAANRELKKLHDAGIEATAALPQSLQDLKYALTAWHGTHSNYGHKEQFLILTDGLFAPDEDTIENFLVDRKYKIYLEGESLEKYQRCQLLVDLLKEHAIDWNHIRNASSLNKIIDANGHEIKPRYKAFIPE